MFRLILAVYVVCTWIWPPLQSLDLIVRPIVLGHTLKQLYMPGPLGKTDGICRTPYGCEILCHNFAQDMIYEDGLIVPERIILSAMLDLYSDAFFCTCFITNLEYQKFPVIIPSYLSYISSYDVAEAWRWQELRCEDTEFLINEKIRVQALNQACYKYFNYKITN